MENIKMQTGIKKNTQISQEQHAFILCFLAIIWRRVLITVYLYCNHNGVTMSSNVVLKCLKYNVLAPTGIGNDLRPYLTRALDVGFLMPEEYKNNIYAERAVKLFGDAYKIINNNKGEEMNFIHEYAASSFEKTSKMFRKELIDTNLSDSEIEEEPKHSCKLCNYIDLWDINLGLVHDDDPYQNVLIYGLLRAFDTYSCETESSII